LKRALPWPVDIDGTLASVGVQPCLAEDPLAERFEHSRALESSADDLDALPPDQVPYVWAAAARVRWLRSCHGEVGAMDDVAGAPR